MENNQKEIINIRKNVKHGMKQHRLYYVWSDMKRRCINPKRKDFKYYGGRGIKVCEEWMDINNFISDMYPTFQEGLSLDRINANGNYEKSNCRWATKTTQSQNTRLLQSNNKSGYRGVSIKIKKYQASISVNNNKIHLGYFDTALEAAKAYDNYVIKNNLEHTLNF